MIVTNIDCTCSTLVNDFPQKWTQNQRQCCPVGVIGEKLPCCTVDQQQVFECEQKTVGSLMEKGIQKLFLVIQR